jgi:hypothetical protein
MLYALDIGKQIWIDNLNFVVREGFKSCGSDEPSGVSSYHYLDTMAGFRE